MTIKLTGASQDKDAFGGIYEVVAKSAAELDLYKDPNAADVKGEFRIVEAEVYEVKWLNNNLILKCDSNWSIEKLFR